MRPTLMCLCIFIQSALSFATPCLSFFHCIQHDTIKPEISTTARHSEWLRGGNLDFISSGLVRSTADILTLEFGNPEKFHLPFYFLVGATTDVFQKQYTINEIVFSDMINEKGGFINFGFNGLIPFSTNPETTCWHLSYQLGAKSISGLNAEAGVHESFFSYISHIGIEFQTAVWQDEQPQKKGKAWLKYYVSNSINDSEKMKALFSDCTEHILFGSNIEGGIDIKEFIVISFGYYKFLNNHHIALFNEGLFKFSADFIIH